MSCDIDVNGAGLHEVGCVHDRQWYGVTVGRTSYVEVVATSKHEAEHLARERVLMPGEEFIGAETVPGVPAVLDTSSSASRQHYIDTGRYLYEGEAL